jgi:hypothetical protein
MDNAAADTLHDQKQSLRALVRLVSEVDLDSLTLSQAVNLYEFYDAVERVAGAGRTMMAPVIDRATHVR